MTTEVELTDWKKELEGLMSDESAGRDKIAEILDKLEQCTVTVELLQKTHVGVTVNQLRKKFKNDDIGKLAAHIQRAWKKLVEESVHTQVPAGIRSRSSSEQSSDSSHINTASPPTKKHPNEDDSPPPVAKKIVRIDVKTPTDVVRRKCVDLLEEALTNGGSTEGQLELAVQIEAAVYETANDGNGRKYQTRIRSKVSNLKNSGNDELRKKVQDGSVSPKKFAEMSAEEMAPPKLRELRKSIEEECIKEHELAEDAGSTHTDQYLCEQCKSRDTSYRISEERMEGDYEPVAVTLIACNKCNHHWKNF